MPASISGFGQDYEQPIGRKTASRLLGEKPIPRVGYQVDVVTRDDPLRSIYLGDPLPRLQHSLCLGNFSEQIVLFSLQPKSEWMRLYGIDPSKP